jgi:hypothetical protein
MLNQNSKSHTNSVDFHRPEFDPCEAGRELTPPAPPTVDFEDAGLLCEGEDDDEGRPSAADADCRRSLEREPGLEDESKDKL